MPRNLVDRPKQGFAIPLNEWLQRDLRNLVDAYLEDDRIHKAGLFDQKLVRRLISDFYAGNNALDSRLWFLLAFEMWREEWA